MATERRIGWGLAALLVAGNMIGSGVYLLPVALAPFGSSSLIAWVLVGLGALALATVFAGLGRLAPSADGIGGYVEQGLGQFAGYVAIVGYWLANLAGIVGIAVAAVGYLAVFFPVLRETWPGALANIAILWLTTFAALFRSRLIAQLGGAALVVGLVPIVLAIAAGALAFDPALFAASWNPSGSDLATSLPASLVLVFWAFVGLECAGVISQRVRDPGRDVGRATLAGVGLAALIYVAATVAVFGVIPAAELARSTSPFADVAGRLMGGGVLALVAVCAVAKATGSVAGWVLINAESARSAARKGYLPRVFGTDLRTPRRNLLIHGVVMTVVALVSAQPTLGGQFAALATVTTVLILVVYMLCCAALIRLTRSTLMRVVAIGGLVMPGWAAASTRPDQLAIALGLLVLISAGWLFVRRGR